MTTDGVEASEEAAESGSLGELTIVHSYEGGTTVEGTTKGSEAHQALKEDRSWGWAPRAVAWLLRSSRNHKPKRVPIELMREKLTRIGYEVKLEIDESMPSVEQQEEDRAERMDDRAERLTNRSEARGREADGQRQRADSVFGNIPFGQPMMPGHHSYRADLNRRTKAWNAFGKSVELGKEAGVLADQAETAAAHMGARHNPVTVGNRIEKFEADRRAVDRRLEGEGRLDGGKPEGEARERLLADAAELDEHIAYWKGVYAKLQEEGKASTAGPDTIAVGDWVKVRGHWYRVRRVNKKSVSLPSIVIPAPNEGGREYTDTTPYREVQKHRRTEEMPEGFVAAYEKPGTERLRITPSMFAVEEQPG